MEQSRIDWPSFVACVVVILGVCIPLALFSDWAGVALQSLYDYIAAEFGIAYLLASSGRKKTRPVPVDLGVVEVRLVPGRGPARVTVKVDAQKVQQALAIRRPASTEADPRRGLSDGFGARATGLLASVVATRCT